MKVKIGDVVNVYPVIMKASFEKMSGKAKLKMIHVIKSLKPVTKSFGDVREDAVKKLAGQDYQDALKKVRQPNDYKEEDVKEALKVVQASDEAYAKFIREETEKEIEVDYEMLDEEDFTALLEGSKDLTPQELMLLSELIAE